MFKQKLDTNYQYIFLTYCIKVLSPRKTQNCLYNFLTTQQTNAILINI